MASVRVLVLAACAAVVLHASVASDVVLKPIVSGKPAVALVLFPGSGYTSMQYKNTSVAVQRAAVDAQSVWVGIVDDSMAAPVGSAVSRVAASLQSAGMPGGTPLFVGAHSPAQSAAVVSWAANEGADVSGLVLLGGFLPRKDRGDVKTAGAFRVPVLTLAGELDGVARITRVGAESLYNQVLRAADPTKAAASWPVVVVTGASHASFASGPPSPIVQERDLVPEVTADTAHSSIGVTAAAFLAAHATGATERLGASLLLQAVRDSYPVLTPLINAMKMDANEHLHPVCNSDYPTNPTCGYVAWPNHTLFGPPAPAPSPLPPSDCFCGSAWVMSTAQSMMAGFDKSGRPTATASTKDSFHDVSDVQPFHLPHIFNNCSSGTGPCQLDTETVSMPVYVDNNTDDGVMPLGAVELKTKLKSRQAMWQAAGLKAADSNVTDGSLKLCRAINEAALQWALDNAPASAIKRFQAVGEALTMVDDVVSGFSITGPEWIKDVMVYKRVANPNPTGKATTMVSVQSWTFTIANLFNGSDPWWLPVGMHYCKLLPLSNAMEWIMVDSLRQFGSLANATHAY